MVAEQTTALVAPQKHEIEDQKGAVLQFQLWLKQNNKAPTTYEIFGYNLRYLINAGANLFEPESVNDLLQFGELKAKSAPRKYNLRKAYVSFMHAYHLQGMIEKPKLTRGIPYIPPDDHLDLLTANAGYELAPALQTLKETACRPIELLRIEWDQIDFLQKTIYVKYPAKDCNPGLISVTQTLIDMLKRLPIERHHVFCYKDTDSLGKTFRVARQRAIQKLGKKELRKIHLYTYRYWRATLEYAENGEGPTMILLEHKSNQYLWKYVQLARIHFGGSPKYESRWIYTDEEEIKANNEGYCLVREDKENHRFLYKKQIRSTATIIPG